MYYWPTESRSVPLEDLGWVNTTYLATASVHCDPTMIWGTTIQTEALTQFVADQKRQTGTFISTAHVLIRAVVEAMHKHPAVNRRVVGRRIHPYDGIHITMPMLETRSGEVNVIYLRHAEQMSLVEISRYVMGKARDVAVRAATEANLQKKGTLAENRRHRWQKWLRSQWVYRMANVGFFLTNRFRLPTTTLEEINGSGAFVNHLGFPTAPPMISYKPSSLPTNSYGVSVTLGPVEMRPVAEGDAIVIRSIAPLFVRLDHRLVNGYQAGEFVGTLRTTLQNPNGLVVPASDSPQANATTTEL